MRFWVSQTVSDWYTTSIRTWPSGGRGLLEQGRERMARAPAADGADAVPAGDGRFETDIETLGQEPDCVHDVALPGAVSADEGGAAGQGDLHILAQTPEVRQQQVRDHLRRLSRRWAGLVLRRGQRWA